ncbi:L,D-transpeptidase [Allocatelliglobosispora scoriae]
MVGGCSADGDAPTAAPTWAAPGGSTAPSATPPAPFTLTVSPNDKTTNLPISTEIGTLVTGGSVTSVTLTDAAGKKVSGKSRADGTTWVPSKPLKFNTRYSATVVGTGAGGETETKTTSFTTMKSAGSRAGTGLYMFDDHVYGVAMPVAVEILKDVPVAARASVQKRFFVETDPPQPGAWYWFNGREVQYRPVDYWQPGTKITVRIALDGHPLGNGRYGDRDRSATAFIAKDKIELKVTNSPKQMQVFKNDALIKTLKVSLGKKSTPSSSGHLVIMDKAESTVFDTFAELGPSAGYRTTIKYAQRLTWGGEFIHSAPWSVGDQGVRNVSHGCVNVSPANAAWLYALTRIGDPVTVTGTERVLKPGNGFTVWDLSWADIVKGSPIPLSADLASATSELDTEPSISPSPSATVEPSPAATPSPQAS